MHLLVVDDDPALGSFLARGLEKEGHEVTLATDGELAIETVRKNLPEMVILDLNLPRRDGTEVLEFLRSLTQDMPILILTARVETETRLRCLEMGADDVMQKPFSFAELRARCRALSRRRAPGVVLRNGDLELNRIERSVKRNGEQIELTNKEFALLEYLLLHRGTAISRAKLLREVWEMNPQAGPNVVDVYVNYLRRKLSDVLPRHSGEFGNVDHDCAAPPVIRTVRGLGYSIDTRA